MHIHARLVEALDFLLDAPAGFFNKGFAFRVDRCEIDQVALGVGGITGSDGLCNLRDGNGNRLSRNPRLKLDYRGLLIRAETGDMEDPILMRFLVFLEDGHRVLVGMIVDELMALRAEKHQV